MCSCKTFNNSIIFERFSHHISPFSSFITIIHETLSKIITLVFKARYFSTKRGEIITKSFIKFILILETLKHFIMTYNYFLNGITSKSTIILHLIKKYYFTKNILFINIENHLQIAYTISLVVKVNTYLS